jgi:hypothetical protein
MVFHHSMSAEASGMYSKIHLEVSASKVTVDTYAEFLYLQLICMT